MSLFFTTVKAKYYLSEPLVQRRCQPDPDCPRAGAPGQHFAHVWSGWYARQSGSIWLRCLATDCSLIFTGQIWWKWIITILVFLFFCLVSAELVPGQFQAMAIQERQHSIDGLGSMLESSLSCTQQPKLWRSWLMEINWRIWLFWKITEHILYSLCSYTTQTPLNRASVQGSAPAELLNVRRGCSRYVQLCSWMRTCRTLL